MWEEFYLGGGRLLDFVPRFKKRVERNIVASAFWLLTLSSLLEDSTMFGTVAVIFQPWEESQENHRGGEPESWHCWDVCRISQLQGPCLDPSLPRLHKTLLLTTLWLNRYLSLKAEGTLTWRNLVEERWHFQLHPLKHLTIICLHLKSLFLCLCVTYYLPISSLGLPQDLAHGRGSINDYGIDL